MPHIATAGNTVIPALLALEALGFTVSLNSEGERASCRARRADEVYVADDPVCLLGLVKLVELGGWHWAATDTEISEAMQHYSLGK